MEKKKRIWIVGGILVVLAIVFIANRGSDLPTDTTPEKITDTKEVKEMKGPTTKSDEWSYDDYNFQFAEGNVEGILDDLIGSSGTVAFYVPPTGYIDVDAGKDFGVAFALNNPVPETGEDYFEYAFVADSSTMENCGVSAQEAQSWIAMGHKSFGKVPKGWVDKMTVYFIFPENVSCTAMYNFTIVRNNQPYGSEQLEFHIS